MKREAIISDGSTARFRDRAMVYNDAGWLFQLIEEGELKATYIYDDNGQRTSKIIYNAVTSTITLYHYDQFSQLISETSDTGAPQRDYIWHENGEAKSQIDRIGSLDNIIYLHSDHLLTSRLATDVSQQVIWRWEGEAFGNTAVVEITGVAINLRFPGQYADRESGYSYNYFRDYDPTLGRYIQSDPIGLLGGPNTFVYVSGNPLVYTDPNGLLNPDGVKYLYSKEDFDEGVKDISEGMREKNPGMSKEAADKLARNIVEKMSIGEARKLGKLKKKNKVDEIEKLLKEICEKTGANCTPEQEIPCGN